MRNNEIGPKANTNPVLQFRLQDPSVGKFGRIALRIRAAQIKNPKSKIKNDGKFSPLTFLTY
jgi:hypothetical protein